MSVLFYNVTSDRDQVVTGLGVFRAGETQVFGPDEAEGFLRVAGIPLNDSNVPAGVTVSIDVVQPAGEKGEEG